jgi:hypothetical protein
MKRWISPARACVKVLQSFSFKVFTSGCSPLVLVVSGRLGEHKDSHLEAAWSGRSLPTCLRSWQARLAIEVDCDAEINKNKTVILFECSKDKKHALCL